MSQPPRNNYAFIDSQNVNLAIRSQGWTLDFARFRRYLKDKYGVTQAYLFIGYIQENRGLYTMLQQQGYVVVFKPTSRGQGGTIKGNVDAELVLHTMIEYPNYDKAVIVTGDGDFHCLADHLVRHNKLERLLIPNQKKFSSLYRKMMPHIHFMNGLRGKLEFRRA